MVAALVQRGDELVAAADGLDLQLDADPSTSTFVMPVWIWSIAE